MNEDEKREFQRMLINCGLDYALKGKKQVYRGTAVNLSANGILFECEHNIKPGSVLLIKVPNDMPTSIMRAEVRVVRVEPSLSGNGFQIAGEILYKTE